MARKRNPKGAIVALGAAFVAGLGILAYAFSSSSTQAIPGEVHGVVVNHGVTLNARQWTYLDALRRAVPLSVPITVTSGLRTYEGQLNAMWTYYQKDPAGFKNLYNVAAERLIKLPYQMWLPEIIKLYDQGILHKDGHLSGGSIDIHWSDLTTNERNAILAGVKATGATYIIESLPLLHVDLPK